MAQLNFANNFPVVGAQKFQISDATLSFVPFNLADSISFNYINVGLGGKGATSSATYTISLGLYSLTGNTLSITNSASASFTNSGIVAGWITLSDTSATQNITPGTWWFGVLIRTSVVSGLSLIGQSFINPANAFPGGFIQGRMTASTAALPSSYATSDLDVTNSDAVNTPAILLSA